MTTTIFRSAQHALVLSLAVTAVAAAQAPGASASTKVAVRQLPAASATTTDSIGSVAAVRQLPNGNVLVNDQARRRVVLFDPAMKMIGLVADSTSNTNNAYGVRPGGLIAYRGDSTLFIEPAGLSMLVIDPAGKIVRTMAAPRANDVNFLLGGPLGNPGFDAKGRLIYRTIDFGFRGARPQPGQPFVPPTPPDSSALVRFDLGTRKLDTVGFFKIPKSSVQMTQDANGGMRVSVTINPLPVVDEWAVMTDGTVAFVRGQDYHVDFIDASGARTAAEKIPYDWQRLTDDDKSRFLDSAKVAIEKQRAAAAASGDPAAAMRAGAEALLGGGGGTPIMMTMTRDAPQRGAPPGGGAQGTARVEIGGGGGGMQIPPVNMVAASELPDYKPVFGPGSIRADMDDRLWVRTIPTKPTPGGAIYDVIDRSGKLVDRVQVPAGTTIAGFGPGGVVYLGMRDAQGLHLQRIVAK
ncbi:MAG: hypothetical protein ABJA80_03240 [bacterium]